MGLLFHCLHAKTPMVDSGKDTQRVCNVTSNDNIEQPVKQ